MERLEESPLAAWRRHLAQGKLAYQVSPDGEPVFFPRVMAPRTGATGLQWRISEGLGTVYSTTVVYRRDEAPLNVALIEMDEGFRLMSRVEGMDAEAVRIGLRVRVTVRDADGDAPYPVFEALEDQSPTAGKGAA